MWRGETAAKTVAAVLASAIVGSTGLAVATRSDVRADTVRSTIVRRDDDRRRTTAPPLNRAASQTIVVTVPSIAVVRLDRGGRIVAAATNTGRAPAAGDLVYVVDLDGSYRSTDIDLTGRRWRGDFSRSMRFQRQADDSHRDR